MIKRKTCLFVLSIFIFSLWSVSFALPNIINAETVDEKEARLRSELKTVEKEIREQGILLDSKRRETASIERDIEILNAEIRSAQLRIRARNIEIEQLGRDIGVKVQTINELEESMERGKESLAHLMRRANEVDSFSQVEIFLSNQNLTDFFAEVDSYDTLQNSLQLQFEEIRSMRERTEEERENLDTRRSQEITARQAIEAERRSIEAKEAEKQRLLSITKGQEAEYRRVLAERERRAAEIRSALFALRDSAAIPFGTALQYAKEAERITGIRPSLLLAVITQESNLGANVGTCFLTNVDTGDGVSVSTGLPRSKTMNPSRDVPHFLNITRELGRDPFSTRVSCQIPSAGGWGGAMGPAQFIPSTWIGYKDRIASLLGIKVADPWNPRHAFLASATFLADLGASNQNRTFEREAAARYYAGGNWQALGLGYADSVLNIAQNIQVNMIDPLEGF